MIPEARGVPKPLFHVRTPKETEDVSVTIIALDERFTRDHLLSFYFSHFRLHQFALVVYRKGLEDKTYPAMDLLVHGESDGATCILVENCIVSYDHFIKRL